MERTAKTRKNLPGRVKTSRKNRDRCLTTSAKSPATSEESAPKIPSGFLNFGIKTEKIDCVGTMLVFGRLPSENTKSAHPQSLGGCKIFLPVAVSAAFWRHFLTK